MNLSNLAAAQEEMRERWSYLRRNPSTRRLTSSEIVEKAEVKQMVGKSDLVCLYCKKRPTTANKRTGEVRPCKPCRIKASNLRKYPGMTLRKFFNMLSAQGGKCAICLAEKWDELVVDRCQEVGHVRGLLCHNCNTFVAKSQESEPILRNAINYLKNNMLRSGWKASSVEGL